MEAHALVARAGRPDVAFPFLCLLVSGGHNLLVVAHGVGRYSMLGCTLDDAVGASAGCRSPCEDTHASLKLHPGSSSYLLG
jgi:hypothetical protein